MTAGLTRNALIVGVALIALGAVLPRQGIASLMPGIRYCGSFDTQQTIDSEKSDLSRELPEAYRKFEIVLFHERLLRVFVPASGISSGSLKAKQIVDLWGRILAAHHRGCAVAVFAVQFYSSAGKPLFETGVEI